jgi:hypothetical protein
MNFRVVNSSHLAAGAAALPFAPHVAGRKPIHFRGVQPDPG